MTVPPSFDQGRVLEAADLAESLAAGSAALFPTDTLPALACRPLNAPLLWTLKKRPADRPLILMGADPEELLAALTVPIRPQWREMAMGHWPVPSRWWCQPRGRSPRRSIPVAGASGCGCRPALPPWLC